MSRVTKWWGGCYFYRVAQDETASCTWGSLNSKRGSTRNGWQQGPEGRECHVEVKSGYLPHRRIPSYIEYMTAALGTTRIKCALRPPYSDRAPSSAMTSRRVCINPVYLITPLTLGCRSRVRSTFKKIVCDHVNVQKIMMRTSWG